MNLFIMTIKKLFEWLHPLIAFSHSNFPNWPIYRVTILKTQNSRFHWIRIPMNENKVFIFFKRLYKL